MIVYSKLFYSCILDTHYQQILFSTKRLRLLYEKCVRKYPIYVFIVCILIIYREAHKICIIGSRREERRDICIP